MTASGPSLATDTRLWTWLAVMSAADLGLTLVGLSTLPGARELNPLPLLAIEHGLASAVLLKAASLLGVLFVFRILRDNGLMPVYRALITTWCGIYVVVDSFSLTQLVFPEVSS